MKKEDKSHKHSEHRDKNKHKHGEAPQAEESVEYDLENIQSDLEKARSEATDYLENLLRLKAEFDNFRKRMIKEQTEFAKYASEELIIALLPVIDNFERALGHALSDEQAAEYKNGMQLVYSQLIETLAKVGLRSVEPVGETFDPNEHEAMMQIDSDEHAEDAIVKVLEKGYVLNDRVIRPAKVMVAKGPS